VGDQGLQSRSPEAFDRFILSTLKCPGARSSLDRYFQPGLGQKSVRTLAHHQILVIHSVFFHRGASESPNLSTHMGEHLRHIRRTVKTYQQQALSIQDENQRLRDEIKQLKANLADTVQGEPCPSCHKRWWRIVSTTPDPTFGVFGVSLRMYKCESCGFSESKQSK